MKEEIKIKEFRLRYIGTEPFSKETLHRTLLDNNYDEGGILEIEETEPTIEKCKACGGVGNIDESAGFELDCNVCKGTGWVDK